MIGGLIGGICRVREIVLIFGIGSIRCLILITLLILVVSMNICKLMHSFLLDILGKYAIPLHFNLSLLTATYSIIFLTF